MELNGWIEGLDMVVRNIGIMCMYSSVSIWFVKNTSVLIKVVVAHCRGDPDGDLRSLFIDFRSSLNGRLHHWLGVQGIVPACWYPIWEQD